jgi:hypothetical protein
MERLCFRLSVGLRPRAREALVWQERVRIHTVETAHTREGELKHAPLEEGWKDFFAFPSPPPSLGREATNAPPTPLKPARTSVWCCSPMYRTIFCSYPSCSKLFRVSLGRGARAGYQQSVGFSFRANVMDNMAPLGRVCVSLCSRFPVSARLWESFLL